MDIEKLREFCLSLPGTTEGLKWGDHLCFMIAEKMYLISSLDDTSFSIKCDPEDFDELVAREGIEQAAYMAKRQWVKVASLDLMTDEELKERIKKSRALVLSKLTKKLQALYGEG
ncbi:MmcQ/YjbR family DNA-binding protein [Pedobacter immunditicola]|uniref:MmcQ/YjbR family DNA-binding protein n=1 Tax=Pedobacter immunditicola TaxID=3133440 RepID=UPI0030B1ECCD